MWTCAREALTGLVTGSSVDAAECVRKRRYGTQPYHLEIGAKLSRQCSAGLFRDASGSECVGSGDGPVAGPPSRSWRSSTWWQRWKWGQRADKRQWLPISPRTRTTGILDTLMSLEAVLDHMEHEMPNAHEPA